MLTRVRGDILLTEAQAIAHGVAPHDHFNQGLALALRERHPAMTKDFRHYCHLQNPKAGDAWLWAGPGRVIINLLTQDPAPTKSGHPGKRRCIMSIMHFASSASRSRFMATDAKLASIEVRATDRMSSADQSNAAAHDSYSPASVTPSKAGSSVLTETGTPARRRRSIGCAASEP